MHPWELARHRGEPPAERAWRSAPKGRKAKRVVRVVYGYLPYWVSALEDLQWDLLTHLAYFAVELDEQGNVTATHGWPDDAVIQAAESTGTRLHVTFTLFSGPGIHALCSDPDRRARAIGNMIEQMEAGGADGVNIDFETPRSETRDLFTLFVAELRQALDDAGHPDAEIVIAGPAWSGLSGVDPDGLLDAADQIFIMEYAFFGGFSSRTGPVGKFRTAGIWADIYSVSAVRSIAAYAKRIPAEKRRGLVYGVPYYGWHWRAESDEAGASVIESVGAVLYDSAQESVESGARSRRWDEDVLNPWYAWREQGVWHQVWYEDAESLAHKFTFALKQDLGGVGIWALGYDGSRPELWDLLEATFGAEPAPQPGDRFDPIRIDRFPFQDARDLREGPSNYFDYYACDPDVAEYGPEWVYQVDLCTPGRLTAHVGEYPDSDPDLHLLSGLTEADCFARDHTDLDVELEPGRYYLVVDTWVNGRDVAQAGPYELQVDFQPAEDATGCRKDQVCEAGVCRCKEGLTECGDLCVDLASDPDNCGECGRRCPDGAVCSGGECSGGEPDAGWEDGGAADGSVDATGPSGDGTGCGCRAAGSSWPSILLLWWGLVAWQRRRGRGA